MTTATLTLTDFLLARIVEDEAVAREALALSSVCDQASVRWHWIVTDGKGSRWHPMPIDPNRVLAECEAKRAIVERYSDLMTHGSTGDAGWVLPLVAHAYADHPDYREEWRP